MKRYLDCSASDLADIGKADLLYAIRASEGRILVSETIAVTQPLLNNVTNAELAASQGADLLLLNLFDVDHPHIAGLPADVPPQEGAAHAAAPDRAGDRGESGGRRSGLRHRT